MTTQYMEEGGFKKKFLAPLVVIMVCAVALAGAAYAYSTSVTGNGDIPGSDYYSIDLYSKNDQGEYTPLSTNFTTIKEKTFVTYTTKTVTGNYKGCVDETTLTFEMYVKVVTSASSPQQFEFTKKEADYEDKCADGSMYSGWSNVEPTVKITNANDDTEPTAYTTGTYYKVTITVILNSLDVDLDTKDPGALSDKLKFNGTNCICLTLVADAVA